MNDLLWKILEHSNMSQQASNRYLVVHALPQKDRDDTEFFYWLLFIRAPWTSIVW